MSILRCGIGPLKRTYISLAYPGGEDFREFPDDPRGVAIDIRVVYSQRYVGGHVVCPTDFQVRGG